MMRFVMVLFTVLACLTMTAAAREAEDKGPEKAIDAVRLYIELLTKGDLQGAAKIGEGIDAANLRGASELLRSGKTRITPVDAREDGDLAIVVISMTDEGRTQFSGGPLKRKDGRWLLARDPEAGLDDAGKQRYQALLKWSEKRCEELRTAGPETQPAN